LYRRLEARHRRHRALDADVVRARGAAADANAQAVAHQAVVSGTVRDCQIQIGAAERAYGFFGVPLGEHLIYSPPEQRALHHATVVKTRAGRARLTRQERGQVSGYRRIGCIRKAELAQAERAPMLGFVAELDPGEETVDQKLFHIEPLEFD